MAFAAVSFAWEFQLPLSLDHMLRAYAPSSFFDNMGRGGGAVSEIEYPIVSLLGFLASGEWAVWILTALVSGEASAFRPYRRVILFGAGWLFWRDAPLSLVLRSGGDDLGGLGFTSCNASAARKIPNHGD